MPTGSLNEHFRYKFCSCRPDLPFHGSQSKVHRSKNKTNIEHVEGRGYLMCLCHKNGHIIPLESPNQELEAFGRRHEPCYVARQAELAYMRENKIRVSTKAREEKVRRIFAEEATREAREAHKVRIEREIEVLSVGREEQGGDTVECQQETETDLAVRQIQELMAGDDSLDFLLDGLTAKQSEMMVEVEEGGEVLVSDGVVGEIEQGEVIVGDAAVDQTEEEALHREDGMMRCRDAFEIVELKDIVSREKRWREALQEKLEDMEKKMETLKMHCLEKEKELEMREAELRTREGVNDSAERVLREKTLDVERREVEIAEIEAKVLKKEVEFKEVKDKAMAVLIEKRKMLDEKVKEAKEMMEREKKEIEERKMSVGQQRTAMIHIPIERSLIVGRPALVRDVDESSQCFGSPVEVCAHLTVQYTGDIGKIKYNNQLTKTRSLVRQEDSDNYSSDDDDFVEKRMRV